MWWMHISPDCVLRTERARLDRKCSPDLTAMTNRTIEQKRGLVKDITKAVTKNFNVSPEAVSIIIHETKKENRAKAGKLIVDT